MEDPIIEESCVTVLDCDGVGYDCVEGRCVKMESDYDAVSPETEGMPDKQTPQDSNDTEKDDDLSDTETDDDAILDEVTEEPDDAVQPTADEEVVPDTDTASDESILDNDTNDTDFSEDDMPASDADADSLEGLPCSSNSQCNQYTEVCYKQKCQSPYRLAYIVKVHEVCLGPKDPNGENWETIPLIDKPDPYAIFNLNGTEVFKTEKGDETFCKTFSASAQISFEETDAVSVVVMEYDSGGLSGDRYAGTLNLPNITVKMFRDGEYAESHPGEPIEYIKLTFVPAP